MIPKDFVLKYKQFAIAAGFQSGIPYQAILTQAAIESGWGQVAPGNMFFGVKDTDGVNGNEQLITTTEYLTNPNQKFPAILSVVKVGQRLWKYKVKDWFRKYPTPYESFLDHAEFFNKNPRYKGALNVRDNAIKFLEQVARAGYATAPNYESTLLQVLRMVQKYC